MTNYKNSISLDDAFVQAFDNVEDIKEYLSYAFEQYIEDGNFNVFYRALELGIKSKDSIREEFCNEALDFTDDIMNDLF